MRIELRHERAEIHEEAVQLRKVVESQNNEVKALKAHAEWLEGEANSAKQRVNEMRVDLIRGSMAAPESMMRILSDYPNPYAAQPPPPSMLDIALDIPPPAAVLRRQAGGGGGIYELAPAYDMGPLFPGVPNSAIMMDRAARGGIANDGPMRPPTQVGMNLIIHT